MRKHQTQSAFTLTELLVTVAIVSILSSIALPNYTQSICRSKQAEAAASVGSLKTIIAAFIDETGVYPTKWDDLTRISAIMSNNGQISGEFTKEWILPNQHYEVTVTGPVSGIYNINAESRDSCKNRSIKACLNTSTGASELKKGNGRANALNVACT